MNRPLLLATLTLLATPLLVSGEGRGTEIAFHVEPGTSLTKTYVIETDITLDNFEMTMNGQAPPMVPGMEMSVSGVDTYEVEDTYSKVADGRPTMFTRSFETLSSEIEMVMELDIMGEVTSEEASMELVSALEGESVEFVWNEEEETHDTVLPDGSPLEEEDIEGLVEDMDFRSLLPTEEVDEGDEWEVELMGLQGVLAPGGNLKMVAEEAVEFGGMSGTDFGSLSDYFNEDLEGECIAVFDGIRKIDDLEIAVIKFTFEFGNAVDITDQTREQMEDSELPEGVGEIEIEHVDLEIAYEGEGVLNWNLAAGHFHSYEASGDFEMLQDQGMLIEAMGQEMSIEQTLEFSGSLTFEVSVE